MTGELAQREPPHNAEAEQSLLGCALNDAMALDAVDVVQPADFYFVAHRVIWQTMLDLHAKQRPVDVITVRDAIDPQWADEEQCKLPYLNAMAMSVWAARHWQAYAQIVRRYSLARQVIAMSSDMAEAAYGIRAREGEVEDLVNDFAQRLLALRDGAASDEPALLQEVLPAFIDELNARAEGKVDAIPTGLHDVDRLLADGVRRGELVVIGARPSMGKSALMLTVARNVSKAGPVLVCSMEDSEHMLVARQVSAAGRVNLADIRRPPSSGGAADRMWTGVSEGVEALTPLRMFIDDTPGLNLHQVRRKALQVKRREGDLLLVVVDYLQLMEGEGETRAHTLATIARGLKRLAKELNCAVLVLSQLSREADKTDGPPRLDHLAESGGIEQAADIIGLLWREARRKPKPDNKHQAQIEFAKQKNGPTDTVQLWFDGATQRFEDAIAGGGDGY